MWFNVGLDECSAVNGLCTITGSCDAPLLQTQHAGGEDAGRTPPALPPTDDTAVPMCHMCSPPSSSPSSPHLFPFFAAAMQKGVAQESPLSPLPPPWWVTSLQKAMRK